MIIVLFLAATAVASVKPALPAPMAPQTIGMGQVKQVLTKEERNIPPTTGEVGRALATFIITVTVPIPFEPTPALPVKTDYP